MNVVIKGAGDLASGVATVLHLAGFRVVMTELEKPSVIRRTVAFAQAVFDGQTEVESIQGVRSGPGEVDELLSAGKIPVLVDPDARIVESWKPDAVVDAILAKRNTGTSISDAPGVVGLGPGFEAGRDVHIVIETMRGHNLGRLIFSGVARENTGKPGSIEGRSEERVLRAPKGGVFRPEARIGDMVKKGEVLARIDGVPVTAVFDGVVRGLLQEGLQVTEGFKVGDVDPRPVREHCFTVSDKARCLGGSVLCSLMYLESIARKKV